jgi:hypothetical protein
MGDRHPRRDQKREASLGDQLRTLDRSGRSDFSRIISPVQQRLALFSPTIEVLASAVLLQLRKMTPHSSPAFNLAQIICAAAAGIIPAIPLKPAARIFVINPALLAPNRERLRCIHTEKIARRFMSFPAELRLFKPGGGKLLRAIRHVLATEDTELQHLFGRELGL